MKSTKIDRQIQQQPKCPPWCETSHDGDGPATDHRLDISVTSTGNDRRVLVALDQETDAAQPDIVLYLDSDDEAAGHVHHEFEAFLTPAEAASVRDALSTAIELAGAS